MGFIIFLLGVGGIAGAVELNNSVTFAVVITILGVALMVHEGMFADDHDRHRR